MSIFGDIDFLAYWELAAIMNFGCSPAQKDGGFFLVILDIILNSSNKFQLVTNFFQFFSGFIHNSKLKQN